MRPFPATRRSCFRGCEAIVIFKEAPAEMCENCGECYLSESVTGKLLERAEKAIENGAEIEIQRFAA